jgi:bifunctional DNase/RNase
MRGFPGCGQQSHCHLCGSQCSRRHHHGPAWVKKSRPLTHDLITHILAGLGARVEKVVINDLKDDTYFARLYLVQENELGRNVVEIDARPSDSMALALQHQCPILVARAVWDAADDMTWALEQATQPPDESGPAQT